MLPCMPGLISQPFPVWSYFLCLVPDAGGLLLVLDILVYTSAVQHLESKLGVTDG